MISFYFYKKRGIMFKIENIVERAKKKQKILVFPEVSFSDKVFEAVKILQKKKIAKILLVGDACALVLRDKKFSEFEIVNPANFSDKDKLVKFIYDKKKSDGITIEQAEDLEKDVYYFSSALVACGYADAMIAGENCTIDKVLEPALKIVKEKNKKEKISSSTLLCGKNRFLGGKALLLSDCEINARPNADELCVIASQTLETAKLLGVGEKVAFLSNSTHGSAKSGDIDVVKNAFDKFSKKEKDVVCDGELQFETALDKTSCNLKAKDSVLQGDADVLIFPDAQSGNIASQAMRFVGGLTAIGVIVQGLSKPVNIISKTCSVEELVALGAITVLQCEDEK